MRRIGAISLGASTVAVGSYWAAGLAVTDAGRRLLRRSVLSRVDTERRAVALTFDDGPDPHYTERFIDALDGSRATFFVLGEAVRRCPQIARSAAQAGHDVASHGDTHRRLSRLGPQATVAELRRGRRRHRGRSPLLSSSPRTVQPGGVDRGAAPRDAPDAVDGLGQGLGRT